MIKALPDGPSCGIVKDQVAVGEQLNGGDTSEARVGLPENAAAVCEDQVSVGAEREGGVFADGVVPVGVPDPTHGALVAGNACSDAQCVGTGGGAVEAELERGGKEIYVFGTDHTVFSVVFGSCGSEFTVVDEREGLVCRYFSLDCNTKEAQEKDIMEDKIWCRRSHFGF